MCADALIAQIIAYKGKVLLDCAFCDGENQIGALNAAAQTIVFDILLQHQRHGEHARFAGLLLHDLQAVAVTVPDDIARAQPENIGNAQA